MKNILFGKIYWNYKLSFLYIIIQEGDLCEKTNYVNEFSVITNNDNDKTEF